MSSPGVRPAGSPLWSGAGWGIVVAVISLGIATRIDRHLTIGWQASIVVVSIALSAAVGRLLGHHQRRR